MILFLIWYAIGFISSLGLMKFTFNGITRTRCFISVLTAFFGIFVTIVLFISEYENIIEKISSYIEKME